MPREIPHGTVTILFTDVVDSTALATAHGDASAHALLQRQRELIRAQIEEHAGREIKTMGDGFMVAFSSARAGVACAIGIQQALAQQAREHPGAPLLVRIGLNTGEAISEGDDLFGVAVNAAARVMHKAAGGQILIAEPVRAVLGAGTEFRFADRGRFRLKGFDERWRLFEVVWGGDAPPPPATEGLPFVRREAELAKVHQALERATGGHGALLLSSGDAGVGKTRLAEECAAHARQRGFLTFAGRCYEDAGSAPYAPFVEIFEALARALPAEALSAALAAPATSVVEISPSLAGLSPTGTRTAERTAFGKPELFAGVRAFLARVAAAQPLLFLLDDVHWADASSLQLLRFLARGLDELPVVVIGTHRDDPIEMTPAVAQTLNELRVKHLAADVALKPFAIEAVSALLEAASGRTPPPGVVQMLHDETQGNAFFVGELYRHLADEGELFDESGEWRPARRLDRRSLPQGLRLVIDRRLERLGPSTRDVLNGAAILGASFSADLLHEVGALQGDALLDSLDEAERAHIIVPEAENADGRFRFAHPLIRSAIVSALASAQRQRLHVRAAAALEASGSDSAAVISELAHHYHAAGRLADPSLAIAALRRAGSAALSAYANIEAAVHLDTALKLVDRVPELPKGDLADIEHQRGQAQYRLGEWARSGASLDRALALYREAGDVHGQAQVLYSKSSLATYAAQTSDALTFLRQAGDLTPDDEALRGLILQLTSQNLVDLRQYEEAAHAAAEALGIAERLDDAYIGNRARIASGYHALATLDMASAVEQFSLVSGSPTAPAHERMGAESRRSIALACSGSLEEAEQRGERAREYFRSMRDSAEPFADQGPERDPYEFGLSCVGEAFSAIARGRLQETERFLGEAIADGGEPPNLRVVRTLTPMLVQVLHYLGRYDEASAAVHTFAPPVNGRLHGFARFYASLDAAARGEGQSAADEPFVPRSRPDIGSLAVAMLAADAAAMHRDVEGARAQIDTLEYLHARGVVFSTGWVVLIPRLLGAAYTLVGNELRAAAVLDAALSAALSCGAATELAFAQLEIAELHAVRGNTTAARASLASAERGMSALGIRCRDTRVASLKTRLESVGAAPAATLTVAEAQILRLIAAGRTNSAIARDRALTDGEVQRQVRALYARIGVSNRVAAVAYAYQQGIVRDAE